jgi:DNA-binding CsgD family transcriptional regulator/tetratricopeptide (TPR) repeat protein
MAPPAGGFIGRQREFNGLKVVLSDVLSGRGRVVLLSGEPGIGKTRLSQELAYQAESQGARVLWGSCYEWQGAPPYWPWVQIIRSFLSEQDPEQLKEMMGAGAGDIAEIVPELGQLIPSQALPSSLEGEQARFRLFESIASFLSRASRECPLGLFLEDLHWADRPSLLLLEFLAQNLAEARLLLLGTCREAGLTRQHPLSNTLGELTRHPCFRRVPLSGVDREAVRRFVRDRLDRAPSEEMVTTLHARTQGNPLFLTEMLRLISQERSLDPDAPAPWAGDWQTLVPQGVRDVIHRRLNVLSEGCNQALTMAAIIGREFDLSILSAAMSNSPRSDLLEALEEALSAHVIEELPAAVGRYRFSHVLVQEAIAQEVSATRRAHLHGLVGEAIEQLDSAAATSQYAAELAYHFAEGAPVVGNQKMVRYSVLAGEQALSTYAYEEAIDHFERALRSRRGTDEDAETAQARYGLACAQGAAGQIHQAWDNMNQVFDYYCKAGEVERAVAVAQYPLFCAAGIPDLQRMVTQALTLAPPDSVAAGLLQARQGLLINLETGEYDRAQEALGHALAIAQAQGDRGLEIQALTNAADVDWYHLRWSEVISRSTQVIALARHSGDRSAEVWPHFLAAGACWSSGMLERASYHAQTMLELAEQLRIRGFLINALVWNAIIAITRGDWEAAREFTDRGLATPPEFFWLLTPRITLEYETGNYEAGEAFLERLIGVARRTDPGPNGEFTALVSMIPQVAYITGVASRFDIAREAAQAFFSSRAAPMVEISARLGLGLIAAIERDPATARECYRVLLPQRGIFLDDGIVCVDRLLGTLAYTMGEPAKAMEHFEESLAKCRRAGFTVETARLCFDYSSALLEIAGDNPRQHEGELERVNSLLEEGLAITSRLGMPPLQSRLLGLKEKAELLAGPPPRALPDHLTQREAEVLRLIAAGKSNQQIADELLVSIHTVIYHVRNIFSKIGAANRSEATAYAIHHRLNS